MDYKSIVNTFAMMLDTKINALYRPIDPRIDRILCYAKNINATGATQFRATNEIHGIHITFIKNLYTPEDYSEVIFLDNRITLLVYVDKLLGECETAGALYIRLSEIIDRVSELALGNLGIVRIGEGLENTIYFKVMELSVITMTIKIIQTAMPDFNKDDISFLNDHMDEDSIKRCDECTKTIFSESVEDLLMNGMLYEIAATF